MATNDIRIDRLEHGVRLLDSGQKKILVKIDEMSARQDEFADRLDKVAANQVKLAKSVSQLTELTFTVLNELKEVKADIADLKPGSRPTGFIKD